MLLPKEAVGVVKPLADELRYDSLFTVGQVHFFQYFQKHGRVVVQGGYHHLQAHGSQFWSSYFPR